MAERGMVCSELSCRLQYKTGTNNHVIEACLFFSIRFESWEKRAQAITVLGRQNTHKSLQMRGEGGE